jgi:hypothetical protein
MVKLMSSGGITGSKGVKCGLKKWDKQGQMGSNGIKQGKRSQWGQTWSGWVRWGQIGSKESSQKGQTVSNGDKQEGGNLHKTGSNEVNWGGKRSMGSNGPNGGKMEVKQC